MQKLIKKAEELALQKETKLRGELKSVLRDALPSHISVSESQDAIEVEGPGLTEQLVENSSLRDVAFLMRGVR